MGARYRWIILGMLVLLCLTGLIFAGYWFNLDWTGFNEHIGPRVSQYQPTKTLWDWLQLLIIPLVLAVAALLFTRATTRTGQKIAAQRYEQDQQIALDKQREDLLQTYLDRMSELLLEKNLATSPSDETRNVARVRTITLLFQLDSRRIGYVFAFLREAGLMSATSNGSIVSLSQANLKKINLSQASLSGADLSGADLSRADLSEANLSRADLSEANLSRADLSGADLSEANLSGAILGGADLSEAFLSGGNLNGANLYRANLSGAVLGGANLSEAFLSEANLNGANLSGADLSGASLNGALLSRANLNGASLNGANLNRANLNRADLSGADLSEANLYKADITKTKVTKEQLGKVKSLDLATMPDV